MIDLAFILFTTVIILFVVVRAIILDRMIPWFRPEALVEAAKGHLGTMRNGWRPNAPSDAPGSRRQPRGEGRAGTQEPPPAATWADAGVTEAGGSGPTGWRAKAAQNLANKR
ncbi:hypothetical protein [Roseomonas marmotae]|uniref:Uncharacterized protein n=2 Tax=Roseomonas marmotae TaxID=2768161 RepID=A0ABS3KHM5_9PROT|nr:hypothetical protein [Roseomonas marmotae]MBO1076979.1 hypothetical protein [Roseomonas marmotae]